MFTASYPRTSRSFSFRVWVQTVPFLERIFRFLASLKLAIFVLGSLMAVLAAGTILESTQGAEAARILIYDTVWFGGLLLLLGTNVLCAALDRIPWKKKHIGFVMTHCGILIILAGSFMTRHSMIDGQMPVAEGETESALTLPQPVIYAFAGDTGREGLYDVPKKAFAWHGRQKLRNSLKGEAPLSLELLSFYPKARAFESVTEAPEGPAALKVTLHNSFVNETRWLMTEPGDRSELVMGPAKLVFARELVRESSGTQTNSGYLEFAFEGRTSVDIPVPDNGALPVALPLEGTPYRVSFMRILRNARVEGRELLDEPLPAGQEGDAAAWPNPAVELVIEGNGLRETHTVFARFPEFPTVHGMKPSQAGLHVYYRIPDAAGPMGAGHELRFVPDGKGGLKFQLKKGLQAETGQVVIGQDTATGWMDMKFKVETYWPHAALQYRFEPQPNLSEAEDLTPAVEIEARAGSKSQRLWLRQGIRETFSLNGVSYQVIYGQRKMPLGFRVELKDFKIENNPGTDQPASFSSDVVMKDDMRGVVRAQTISMNKPLEYRGFKIYQAAYSLVPGEPEVSVFSVGRDPGVPVKYAGAVVMIAGIITMFSMRRLYQKKSVKS